MNSYEQQLEPLDEYRRSAEHLFVLLAASQDKISPHFYTPVWDDADPTVLRDVTTMVATPTGARKDQRWGQFYRAQFQLTETSLAGDISQHFAWCYTGPSDTGSSIELDVSTLTEEYGYKEIIGPNILSDLTPRTKSVDDHLTLVHLMQEYDVRPTATLTIQVNRLITRFMAQQIEGSSAADQEQLDRDKMLELIGRFLTLDSRTQQPRSTQSYVVAPILHAIHHRNATETLAISQADNAAALLKTILEQNLVPEGAAKDRVFGSVSIYRYPFAVEALYEYLKMGYGENSSTHIFDMRRIGFVGEYIATTVQAAHPALAEQISQVRRQADLHDYKHGYREDYARLCRMIGQLVGIINKEFPDPDIVPIPIESSLSYIGRGFAYVLARLNGHSYKEDENSLYFDARKVRTVEHILAPLYRRIGGPLLLTISNKP